MLISVAKAIVEIDGAAQTNQVGYITVIAWLLGIYGIVNRPCPRASPSDSGRFTAINPQQPCYNYYLTHPCYLGYKGAVGYICSKDCCLASV